VNRKLVLATILVTVLIDMLGLSFTVQKVEASGTIYIRANGRIEPQDAPIKTSDNVTYTLNESITGDTDGIVVERSNIVIDGQDCTVEGAGTHESKGVYLVACNNVTLKNVKVANFTFGVYLNNSFGNNISENIFVNNGFGVFLYSSSYNNIHRNIMTDNYWGVWLEFSLNNTLLENEVIKNDLNGILLSDSSNNTLQENDIMENGGDGIHLEKEINETSGNCIFKNNIVNNEWSSIELSGSNYNYISENQIAESDYVLLSNSNNNEISRNNMTNNVDGVLLMSSSNNTILGNSIIESAFCGIWLLHSPYNCIVENAFVDCGLDTYSCDLFSRDSYWSYGNVVRDNIVNGKPLVYLQNISNYTVTDAGQVILVNCNNVYVENLNLSNASKGIQLWNTNNSIIANNIITNNWICVDLCYSHNNTMHGNFITTNFGTQSINIEFNIALEYSSNNKIFNNFIANRVLFGGSEKNVWDNGYPYGGNYWSDYSVIDIYGGPYQNLTGSDGIGDMPYSIYANNTDHYPLMGMFSDFVTSEYHVQTICNSTISDFRFNGTAICFNVTGESGTVGFCRICIPTALMNALFKVYVNGTEISYNLLSCSNETYSYIYFTYTHSTQEVIIVLEFRPFLILPLFMVVILLAVVVYRKKRIDIK
jgi:parallel beta-helix repeat protein